MKKILALILAALMLFAMVSCGDADNAKDTDTTKNAETASTPESDTNALDTEADTNADTEATDTESSDTDVADTDVADTEADTEAADTNAPVDGDLSLEDVAKAIVVKYAEFTGAADGYDAYVADMPEGEALPLDEYLASSMAIVPVEAGAEFVQGFNTVPTGFTSAVQFMPMMMGQAFMGFIFEVEEGGDVEAFKEQLKSNANPRWNICTEADTTICESAGNYVYFNMLVTDPEMFGFTEDQVNTFINIFKSAFGA